MFPVEVVVGVGAGVGGGVGVPFATVGGGVDPLLPPQADNSREAPPPPRSFKRSLAVNFNISNSKLERAKVSV